ncbi:MAG: hypothetical protein EZS28_000653 [Streblomastix strix]|uniref:Uncharacterized protein n=1 Tax=Streblomastix strix TaxID=222440 RepID=A0A5J4X976_9EUKA|nr:MAG: hypothetical protein EZS28_000653 [Streblomastix strix]
MVQTYNNSNVDDALQLLKADKTQLIDSYSKSETYARDEVNSKGQTNNFLNIKADNGVSYSKSETYARDEVYTKGEDDALLLLKGDKTQLIDSFTKGEDDALLLLKANQSTTYIKIETIQLISQIEVGDVDLSGYFNKTKTDELLGEKTDATELSNYVTLGTSWTINANKTFKNACRFVNTIDGMSTITGSSFVKSGADNTVVLLGAGGTKPISEFTTTIDDSNYVKKDGDVQDIQGILRKTPLNQPYPVPTDDDYITLRAVKNEFVSSIYSCSISDNLTATKFIKTGKDDISVLLVGGGDALLSSFGGVLVEDITNLVVDLHSNITFNYLRLVRIGNFYHLMMDFQPKAQIIVATNTYVCTIGSFSNTITPPTPANAVYLISIITRQTTLIGGLATRQIRIFTDSTTPRGINDVVGVQFRWMF